jgi:hypothetical protein
MKKTMTESQFLKLLAPHMEKLNDARSMGVFKTEKRVGMALSKYFVTQALEVKDEDAYVRLLSISLMGAVLRDGITLGFLNVIPNLTREKVLTPEALAEFSKLLTDVRSTVTKAMRGLKRNAKAVAKPVKAAIKAPAKVASKTRGRSKGK